MNLTHRLPLPAFADPCSSFRVERKAPEQSEHQASSSQQGWLIWMDSLEITPVGRYQSVWTSHCPHRSPTLLRGAGVDGDAGSQQIASFPSFSFEALRTESNMHFQQLRGRGFPGEASLIFPSLPHPGQGLL